jgi:hypothetical protein
MLPTSAAEAVKQLRSGNVRLNIIRDAHYPETLSFSSATPRKSQYILLYNKPWQSCIVFKFVVRDDPVILLYRVSVTDCFVKSTDFN